MSPINVPAKFCSINNPLSLKSNPSNVWLSSNPCEPPPKLKLKGTPICLSLYSLNRLAINSSKLSTK